jgi:hypothetical protein
MQDTESLGHDVAPRTSCPDHPTDRRGSQTHTACISNRQPSSLFDGLEKGHAICSRKGKTSTVEGMQAERFVHNAESIEMADAKRCTSATLLREPARARTHDKALRKEGLAPANRMARRDCGRLWAGDGGGAGRPSSDPALRGPRLQVEGIRRPRLKGAGYRDPA